MEQLVKQLAKSQKLQDIGAVVRGADRVISVWFTHLNRSFLTPFVKYSEFIIFDNCKIASETRRSQYIYEQDDYSIYNDPDYDSNKKFDLSENQPVNTKDIDSTVDMKGQHVKTGIHPEKPITNSSQNLFGTVDKKSSTMIRNHDIPDEEIHSEVKK